MPWPCRLRTHCLTGCVIGEVAGMAIGTALGWGNLATIVLAVGLAYMFGFALTSLPLFRAGLTLGAIVPIALAADTVSITIMEVDRQRVRTARSRRDGGGPR